MSVGFFMGVRASYVDEAVESARAYVAAINNALGAEGLQRYVDPAEPPEVYSRGGLFGRSALDHHSARCLVRVAEIAMQSRSCLHLALLIQNPYRVAFVPIPFERPLQTSAADRIAGSDTRLSVGSAPTLFSDLVTVAKDLGIPMVAESLADDTASRINEYEALYNGDSRELAEDERTAWLVLYEGARLANERKVALSLAG